MFRYASIPPALFTMLLGFGLPGAASAEARVSESYGKLPLHFEANQGQAHQDVRFLSRGSGYSLYLTADEAVLVLTRPNADGKQDGRSTPGRREAPAQAMPAVLRMSIVGAAPAPLVSGREELPGKANYFIGRDPAKWRTNVPTYAKVHYRGVYPGIDLVYYGNQRQLEYDFVVAPGADPKKIVLGFKGADKVEIDAQGDLVLHAPGGAIRQKKPAIYQEIDGVRQEIEGRYVRKGAKRVGFKVAAYDTNRPLIIDPVVLSYSTYLGGSGTDTGFKIAVDADRNAYVTGETRSTNFPTTLLAFQLFRDGSADGASDVFVTKLNSAGTALIYSTYLGGNGHDRGSAIAVDADGNAYVTGGTTSTNFPISPGAFQSSRAGDPRFPDVFVTKLDPTGSQLIYSTYLGGSHSESGQGIAVDAGGYAYVTGSTGSVNFPTTSGAYQTTLTSFESVGDVFVTKLNPAGSGLVYSTYLGSSSADGGGGIAVDAAGNAYVTGSTEPIEGQATDFPVNFPTTPGAYQTTAGGGNDAFVTKLDPSGSALVYSTYLGGRSHDYGIAIAVDGAGNAYVAGQASFGFPTTTGAFQTTCAGTEFSAVDAFVTKLNSAGSAAVYSTCLGASNGHVATSIAADAAGNAYITGSASIGFPTTLGAFQPIHGGGGSDAFVTKVDPTGSTLVYSTYLGGSSVDGGTGIAMDTAGNAYVTGGTRSTNFPTTLGVFQPAHGGSDDPRFTFSGDAFVAKIVDDTLLPPPPPPPPPSTTRSEEGAATYQGYWPTYGPETGTFSGGTIVASNQVLAAATFSFTGTAVSWIGVKCNVCGIAMVSIDGGAPAMVNTFGPGVPGSLTSEVVYAASGLAPGVTHTLVITVTGTTTGGATLLTGGSHIAVDAFDVTR